MPQNSPLLLKTTTSEILLNFISSLHYSLIRSTLEPFIPMAKSKDGSKQPLLVSTESSVNNPYQSTDSSQNYATASNSSLPRTASTFQAVGVDHEEEDYVGNQNNHSSAPTDFKFNLNDDDDNKKEHWSQQSWSQRWRYASYYLPVTTWLPKYNFKKQIFGDVIAGLTVGAMLTPQSMSYASILQLPPINGLVTAFFAGLIYFVLGHSPVLTVGPEATTSILLGETIINLPNIKEAKERGEDIVALCYSAVAAISFLCGVVTLLLGLFRLGFVDGVFSRPVLSGFITAVGLQLWLDQTPKVLGLKPCAHCETTMDKLHYLFEDIVLHWRVNYCAMMIGIGCILFLALFKHLKSKYPESPIIMRTPHIFIMVIFCTLLSWIFDFEGKYHISVIGNKNSAFPTPELPTILSSPNFSKYLSTAIILSVLGFVETQLVNKTIQLPNTTISPNRELVALGTMHVITSCLGGYAAFGSLTRTRVSMMAGTTSQIANLVAISICLTSMLVLMKFFAFLPNAVTGGIVWFVATSLIETHETIFTFQTKQWVDFCLNIVMIIITFFFGVDIGLFFAFAVCLLLVIKQQNKPSVRLLGRFNNAQSQAVDAVDEQGQISNEQYVEFNENAKLHQSLEGILIYQIDGPLFFCNAENLKDRMRRIEMFGSVISHPSQPPHPLELRAIIFDLQSVTSIDATAAAVLLELVEDYQKRDIRVVFVKLRRSLLPLLVDAGIVKKIGINHFKRSISAAVDLVESQTIAEQQPEANEYV